MKSRILTKSIRLSPLVYLLLLTIISGTSGVVRASSTNQNEVRANAAEGVYLPVIFQGISGQIPPGPTPPPEDAGWLSYVNYYRALAGLSPVAENSSWSDGGWLHARYMVKNDYVSHSEDPQKPWYTPEGDQAARTSNLMASSNNASSDYDAIDLWMQAPFHAVGILDPELGVVGYGSFREADGGLQMGAALDVIRGLLGAQTELSFPVAWPGEGTTVPLSAYFTEYPDPLTSCPGYQAPSGLPIILQLGAGNIKPNVTAYSIKLHGEVLDACVFDETSYQNPDPDARRLGRSILDSRDAIVLIPRLPLSPGETYTVSITANGQTYRWSFNIAEEINLSQTLLSQFDQQSIIIR